jgi:tripartite-type tricarboxylate transporter receptor subunit TctC
MRRTALVLFVAALGAAWTLPAAAQTWPTRIVKFIVPLGPGSGVDIGARLFADRLSARWGQPVVVENRPGGDGIVGVSAFAGSRDDHILLVSPTSAFTAHPYQHESLPYKASDLVPIVRISNTVLSVAVPTSLKLATLADMVAMIRAEPGKHNWAGTTGATDFVFEGFFKSNGLEIAKVPYRNGVEAANDLAEARVQVYQSAFAISQPQYQAGRIKVLAVTNHARAPILPQIPTVAEAGFPTLTIDGLVGIFGPPSLPASVREKIATDVRTVSADPIIIDRLNVTAQILNIGSAAEFAEAIGAQRAQLVDVAKILGVTAARQ